MIGETQEQFLSRVRAALARTGETPVPQSSAREMPVPQPSIALPDDLEVARVVGTGEDIVARFLLSVEQAKMVPHRVNDGDAVAERIVEIVGAAGARLALIPAEDWPGREQVEAALRASGVDLLNVDDLDAGFVADVGITGVDAAIAETGSICLNSGGERRRLASLAVPIHIGVVRAEQIVADLLDWAGTPSSSVPSSAVLVSAPSKTADIELTLVMGVHGPRIEHVIVVG